MTDKEYKKAWQELKDELISDFYKETERLKNIPKDTDFKFVAYMHGKVEGQRNETISHLMKMEDLDGTHEFNNLLDDMNREDK